MVRNSSSSRFLDVFGASTSTSTLTSTTTRTTSTNHGLVPPYVPQSTLLDQKARPLHNVTPLSLSAEHSVQAPQRQQSTRIQLQRTRLREQAANALVSNAIPGFKTSAAFFASLRANLRLSTSPPPSPMSTPPSMRASASSLPPPSPLSQAEDDGTVAADPLAGVPELSTYLATTEEDKTEALMLVADSVAQMRQQANLALIWHPLNFSVFVACLAVMATLMQKANKDIIAMGMAGLGITMAYLMIPRLLSQGYIVEAERINWEWTHDSDFLITKFGDEVIAVLLVEWVADARAKRKKTLHGAIRAWTVKKRYRNKEVGSALLRDAVRMADEKAAEDLVFAEDHANHKQLLHKFYNGPFVKQERKQREKLRKLWSTGKPGKRGLPE